MKRAIIEIHFKEGYEVSNAAEIALLLSLLPDIIREMQEQDTEE